MATRIRLKRMGRRNRPFFRVVVMDSRAKRDGASIEELGWYDPIRKEDNFSLKEERILHWLKQGAQPTDTVRNLMKKSGLAHRWHLVKRGLDEETIDQEIQKLALDRQEREKTKAARETELKETVLEEEGEAPVEEPEEGDKAAKEPQAEGKEDDGSSEDASTRQGGTGEEPDPGGEEESGREQDRSSD
ncbi:MAG: 30S ribosomal protein S16 [Fidelibacterota bacterium]